MDAGPFHHRLRPHDPRDGAGGLSRAHAAQTRSMMTSGISRVVRAWYSS
jgi:hypothetical protein